MVALGASDAYVLEAVKTAIGAEIDIGGTVHPVEIPVKDSQSNPNHAAEAASQLILDDGGDLMLAASTADTTNPVADQCARNEGPASGPTGPGTGISLAGAGTRRRALPGPLTSSGAPPLFAAKGQAGRCGLSSAAGR